MGAICQMMKSLEILTTCKKIFFHLAVVALNNVIIIYIYISDELDSDVIEKNNRVVKEFKDKQKQKGFFDKYFSCCFCKKCCKVSGYF